METTATVAVRIRPLDPYFPDDSPYTVSYEENTIAISFDQESLETQFDKIFGPFAPQEEIFNFIHPLIEKCEKGISSTILTYGQSRSGKAYTMLGYEGIFGIVPRVISSIFRILSSDNIIRFSMICIDREKIIDLLRLEKKDSLLDIKESADYGIYIQNLSEYIVKTPDEALNLLEKGRDSFHSLNTAISSIIRKSILCQIKTISTNPNENGQFYRSKIMLCNLTGSERIGKIIDSNNSMVFLRDVVHNLVENNDMHIPYRNSILTFLLKESLEGQHNLALIANIYSQKPFAIESLNTLKFANEFKKIKINTKTQEISSKDLKKIENFERKAINIKECSKTANYIKKLRKENKQNQNNRACYKDTEEIIAMDTIRKNMMFKPIKPTENNMEIIVHEKNQLDLKKIKNGYRKTRVAAYIADVK